jgi:hypothetical protein
LLSLVTVIALPQDSLTVKYYWVDKDTINSIPIRLKKGDLLQVVNDTLHWNNVTVKFEKENYLTSVHTFNPEHYPDTVKLYKIGEDSLYVYSPVDSVFSLAIDTTNTLLPKGKSPFSIKSVPVIGINYKQSITRNPKNKREPPISEEGTVWHFYPVKELDKLFTGSYDSVRVIKDKYIWKSNGTELYPLAGDSAVLCYYEDGKEFRFAPSHIKTPSFREKLNMLWIYLNSDPIYFVLIFVVLLVGAGLGILFYWFWKKPKKGNPDTEKEKGKEETNLKSIQNEAIEALKQKYEILLTTEANNFIDSLKQTYQKSIDGIIDGVSEQTEKKWKAEIENNYVSNSSLEGIKKEAADQAISEIKGKLEQEKTDAVKEAEAVKDGIITTKENEIGKLNDAITNEQNKSKIYSENLEFFDCLQPYSRKVLSLLEQGQELQKKTITLYENSSSKEKKDFLIKAFSKFMVATNHINVGQWQEQLNYIDKNKGAVLISSKTQKLIKELSTDKIVSEFEKGLYINFLKLYCSALLVFIEDVYSLSNGKVLSDNKMLLSDNEKNYYANARENFRKIIKDGLKFTLNDISVFNSSNNKGGISIVDNRISSPFKVDPQTIIEILSYGIGGAGYDPDKTKVIISE